MQLLYWLPPIFLLWANLHIQFVYGLFLIGLFVGVSLGGSDWRTRLGLLPSSLLHFHASGQESGIGFVRCLHTRNPGGPELLIIPMWRSTRYSKAKFAYSVIQELQPLTFRWYNEYAELLLTAAGFFAVGWQKKLRPIQAGVADGRRAWLHFAPCATPGSSAFQPRRASRTFLRPEADSDHPRVRETRSESWFENAGVAVAVVVVYLSVLSRGTDFNQRSFDRGSDQCPISSERGINFLRRNPGSRSALQRISTGAATDVVHARLPGGDRRAQRSLRRRS